MSFWLSNRARGLEPLYSLDIVRAMKLWLGWSEPCFLGGGGGGGGGGGPTKIMQWMQKRNNFF